MRTIFFRLGLVGVIIAVGPLAYAQLLTQRDLSYSMAKTIAETAIDSCAAKGYAVSAVVVDRAGDIIVAMRADNAGPQYDGERTAQSLYRAQLSHFDDRLCESASPITTRWCVSR